MSLANRRVLAVDPSLRSSGWALFCLQSQKPMRVGIMRALGTEHHLSRRIADLRNRVLELFSHLELGVEDFLVCEGPAPLVLNPNSSLKLEQVRGVFENVAREKGVSVPGRLNPRTVQVELLGMRGKQLSRNEVKLWARETAKRLFGEQLERLLELEPFIKASKVPQDIIDASLIGSLAVSRISISLNSNTDVFAAFAPRSRSAQAWKMRG